MNWAEVKAIAERALADGTLTQAELDEIMAAIMADDRISDEEQELMASIQQKVLRGEIKLE